MPNFLTEEQVREAELARVRQHVAAGLLGGPEHRNLGPPEVLREVYEEESSVQSKSIRSVDRKSNPEYARAMMLDVLNEMAEPYWDDDASAGGAALVAAVGGRAVLEDAWVDEIQSSPVHLVHALRPIADDCARLHDAIRARLTVDKIDLALDRPLADAADAATAAADDATLAGAAAAPVLDAVSYTHLTLPTKA